MITTKDAVNGTLVSFIDVYHSKYPKLKNYFGVIIEQVASNIVNVEWYEDEECTVFKTTYEFYFKRLKLRDKPSIISRTKLEKKCRKLWNNSNWVKANSSRAY